MEVCGNKSSCTFLISEGPKIPKNCRIFPVDFPSSKALTIEVTLHPSISFRQGIIEAAPLPPFITTMLLILGTPL